MKTSALTKTSLYEEARLRMGQIPLPSLKDENFRYTPVKEIDLDVSEEELFDFDKKDLLSPSSGFQIISNSQDSFWESPVSLPMILKSFDSDTHFSEVLPLSAPLNSDILSFAALANVFGGFDLVVPENTQLEIPVEHFAVISEATKVFRNRIRIHLKKNSSLRLFNSWSSLNPNSEALVYSLQSFLLEEGAQLDFCDYQNLNGRSRYFIRQEFLLHRDSSVNAQWASMGGQLGQTRVHVDCLGSGANFQASRALQLKERQHSDFWIENWHSAPAAESSFTQSSIIDEKARSVFNGLIRIFPNQQKSVSSHQSKSLLLSDQASSENMPRLIIETDDVQVAHGASVSSMDKEQLYYLQSRGVSADEAKEILRRAFLVQSWAHIERQDWKQFLEKEFFGDEVES